MNEADGNSDPQPIRMICQNLLLGATGSRRKDTRFAIQVGARTHEQQRCTSNQIRTPSIPFHFRSLEKRLTQLTIPESVLHWIIARATETFRVQGSIDETKTLRLESKSDDLSKLE